MFKKWFKKKTDSVPASDNPSTPASGTITWHPQATQALELTMKQAPVPAPLKGRVRQELVAVAEDTARSAGHSEVTPEDLMTGLMNKLPPAMRKKAERMIAEKTKRGSNPG